jgi:hypothetical protein
MPGLVPGIHAFGFNKPGVDGRDTGAPTGPARSGRPDDKLGDAVFEWLCPAMTITC